MVSALKALICHFVKWQIRLFHNNMVIYHVITCSHRCDETTRRDIDVAVNICPSLSS